MRMADLYMDAGMDVIAVVDPLVSQISPRHFTKLLSAPYTDCIRPHPGSRCLFLFLCVWRCDEEYRSDVSNWSGFNFSG